MQLRADHIAAVMGARVSTNWVDDAFDELVVFIKKTDPELVSQAKEQGCVIGYDVLDWLCYPDRPMGWFDMVDVCAVPARACIGTYAALMPNARFVVIPHQWDYRISELAEHDEFRPGYIGAKFNVDDGLDVPKVTDNDRMVAELPRYNCHISVHPGQHGILKPATKVANAAGVMANIVTAPHAAALELLGDDYPYIVRESTQATLDYARETFGTPVWYRGLETMARVRERTSLAHVAALWASVERQLVKETDHAMREKAQG